MLEVGAPPIFPCSSRTALAAVTLENEHRRTGAVGLVEDGMHSVQVGEF